MQPTAENNPQLSDEQKIADEVFKMKLKLEDDRELRLYAVKRFPNCDYRDKEFETHQYITRQSGSHVHDSIVKAYIKRDFKHTDHITYHCIVLELEGETMEKQLAIDVPPFDDTVRRRHLKHFRELIDALCCLHRKGVHCDIKPANILLKRSGTGEGYVFIDFGVSVRRKSSIPHDKSFNEYSSPDNKTDKKSDVWSLACVFLELLIWVYLDGKADVDAFRADKKSEREKYLPQCHADKTEYFYICEHEAGCVRLNPAVEKWLNKIGCVCQPVVHVLQSMLNIDPEKRSTAEQALQEFSECIES